MSIRVIAETNPKARKDHNCDSCDWLLESGILYEKELAFAEYRAVVKAKRNGWKIKKGDIYNKQVNFYDDIYTFKSIPAIMEICHKYNLFEV